MNLYLFLSTLRARFGVFAFLLAVTVLATIAASMLLPKTYTAMVSLLVDAKEEQSLSNVLYPLIGPQERISYMQTQMDVITSRKVARKVVQDLNLAQSATALADFKDETANGGSIEDSLVENLLQRLKVETSQSRFSTSESSIDPPFAVSSLKSASAVA